MVVRCGGGDRRVGLARIIKTNTKDGTAKEEKDQRVSVVHSTVGEKREGEEGSQRAV